MKPFLIALCFLIAGNAAAQGFSAGLRSGAGHWIAINHDGAALKPTNKVIWEKGVYARYEAKRFAYEVQALNYNFYVPQLPFSPLGVGCGNTSTKSISESSFSRTNEYSLAVQYRVAGKQTKLKNYVGLNLALAYYKNHWENNWEYISTLEKHTSRGVQEGIQGFIGINHYASYTLNKHLNVHSAMSLNIDPADVAASNPWTFVENNYSRFSINIGCGYTF